jgi:hypothetical protein
VLQDELAVAGLVAVELKAGLVCDQRLEERLALKERQARDTRVSARLLPGLLPNSMGDIGTENDRRTRNCPRIRILWEATGQAETAATEFQDRCF